MGDFVERRTQGDADPKLQKFLSTFYGLSEEDSRHQRIRIALSLTIAAQALHENELEHHDLHAGNIMIGADARLHIIDWDEGMQTTPENKEIMFRDLKANIL